MAKKTAKKTVRKVAKKSAQRVASRRANSRRGQLIGMTGSPWSVKEQALSWALQIPRGQTDARQVISDAKHFEEYLSGGAVRK